MKILKPKYMISESIARIRYDDYGVYVYFEFDKNFIKVIKSLGYEWDGEKWVKEINEYTGETKDRVAETGNKLLLENYAIETDIPKKTVDAQFEPECTRWILRNKEEDLFAITWRGFDKKLYKAAKSLPSAKWKGNKMYVEGIQYEAILDFAETFEFQFSNSAVELLEKMKNKDYEIVEPALPEQVHSENSYFKEGVLDDLKD